MFGLNLVLILIMQEKDSVFGEIKYSLIPIFLNNGYVVYSNYSSVKAMIETNTTVHQKACIYSVGFYILSWVGYAMMDQYQQGLYLQSSKEMFIFAVWETLFLTSMALGFFYSWQTYSKMEDEVEEVALREVWADSVEGLKRCLDTLCMSRPIQIIMYALQPILDKLEKMTGPGGYLGSNSHGLNQS
jgi:hypothetical protein